VRAERGEHPGGTTRPAPAHGASTAALCVVGAVLGSDGRRRVASAGPVAPAKGPGRAAGSGRPARLEGVEKILTSEQLGDRRCGMSEGR
jgi:hypothetical protein